MSPTPAPWHLDVQKDGGKRYYRLCGTKDPIHRKHIATLNAYGDPLGDGDIMVGAPEVRAALIEVLDGFWHHVEAACKDDPEAAAIADDMLERAQQALKSRVVYE